MTEAQLQKAVIELAHRLGWKVCHFHPAQVRPGVWATPVEADGAGFPDLILAHPTNHMAAMAIELKTDVGRVAVKQQEWLDLLDEGGLFSDVWRPKDWVSGRIESILSMNPGVRPIQNRR